MLGISLATAMVFTAGIPVVRGLSYSVAIGNEATARSLAIVPISQISMFAVYWKTRGRVHPLRSASIIFARSRRCTTST